MLVLVSSMSRDLLLALPGELDTALAVLVNTWLLVGSGAGPMVFVLLLEMQGGKQDVNTKKT